MFKITPNPTFPAPVSGFIPGAPRDGMKVHFVHLDADQYQDWIERNREVPLVKSLPQIISSWEDAPVEYSPEALESLSKTYPALPQALMGEYVTNLFTVARKN
jgi:hypothetical protein